MPTLPIYRWSLLRHTVADAHWHLDWLMQSEPLDPNSTLFCFRVQEDPSRTNAHGFQAQRIADHRAIYLTFEGELSENRGRVERIGEGTCHVHISSDECRIDLIEHKRRWIGLPQVLPGWWSFTLSS